MWFGVAPRTDINKNGYQKDMCSIEIGLYDNHSKLNSQHNRRGLFDHLMSTRIFTLIMRKNFIRALKISHNMDLPIILYLSCVACHRRSGLSMHLP